MVLIILFHNIDFVIFKIILFSRYFITGNPQTLTRIRFQVEDCKMSTVSVRNKASKKFLKLNGIKAAYFDPGDKNQNCSVPPDTTPLEIQVAGHSFGDGKNTLGAGNFFVFIYVC